MCSNDVPFNVHISIPVQHTAHSFRADGSPKWFLAFGEAIKQTHKIHSYSRTAVSWSDGISFEVAFGPAKNT